jgi:hypothetical protein
MPKIPTSYLKIILYQWTNHPKSSESSPYPTGCTFHTLYYLKIPYILPLYFDDSFDSFVVLSRYVMVLIYPLIGVATYQHEAYGNLPCYGLL